MLHTFAAHAQALFRRHGELMTTCAHNMSTILWLLQAKAKARVEVVGSGKGCAAAKSTATAGGHVLAVSLHCRQHACRSCSWD
jgi:hypothetical protein